ncbi:MAG: metallophosphoesterase family protein [Candidatus Wallbacteria bacterium]|nr:metallophosphoesterase family protein [Candidatus Wallbacteria bacterium]
MKILHISDEPDELRDTAALAAESPDLILTSGDLPRWVYDRIRAAMPGVPFLGVRGNHDSPADLTPEEDLHLRVVEFRGVRLGGFQGSWRYKPAGRYLYDEEQVEAALARHPGCDVFVTHNPPALENHEVPDGVHDGFRAFVEYCSRHRVQLLLHGHSNVRAESRMGATRVLGTYGWRSLTFQE